MTSNTGSCSRSRAATWVAKRLLDTIVVFVAAERHLLEHGSETVLVRILEVVEDDELLEHNPSERRMAWQAKGVEAGRSR